MEIKKGDLVTRSSYNHDTVFKVINIKKGVYYLKGIEARLYASSEEDDLKIVTDNITEDTTLVETSIKEDRDDFFYMPAKVLHIDGDSEYLDRCLKYYKKVGIYAIGKRVKEDVIAEQIVELLNNYRPDIVIITGHDAYYRKKGDPKNIANYKNSSNFVKAIKAARNYERSHEKLVIIAGACQSYYEELIRAGANFASSPKRVNIHALDPALIATTIATTEKSKTIDLIEMLNMTKYGIDGMGGIITNGLMYVGYPR